MRFLPLVLALCACRSFEQEITSEARELAPRVADVLGISEQRTVHITVMELEEWPYMPGAYDRDLDVFAIDPRIERMDPSLIRFVLAHELCHALVPGTRWEELCDELEEGLCNAAAHIVVPEVNPTLTEEGRRYMAMARERFGL